jgi:hypothetical protein
MVVAALPFRASSTFSEGEEARCDADAGVPASMVRGSSFAFVGASSSA